MPSLHEEIQIAVREALKAQRETIAKMAEARAKEWDELALKDLAVEIRKLEIP